MGAAAALGGVLLLLVAGLAGLLIALDSGRLDGAVARFASRRLGQPVTFTALDTRLFAARPTVGITGLKVGNPAWATGRPNLLTVRRLRAQFAWPALLSGRLTPSELDVEGADAWLLRIDAGRQNWPAGRKPGGDPLAGMRRLRVVDSRFDFDDRSGQMRLTGTVVHDVAADATWPMRVAASGVIHGGGVTLAAKGGRLNARPRGAGHAIEAELRDGSVRLKASGKLDAPLSFKGFDLAVEGEGPNLVALEYLLNLGTPNSAPFRLSGRVQRKGEVTRATGLKGVIGESDLAGSVVSDGSGRRRVVSIDLRAGTLHVRDLAIILSEKPPHAIARITPGNAGPPETRLFSDKRLNLARFNLRDYRLKLSAQRFVTGALAPGRLTTSGRLDNGVLALDPFTIDFPSGRLAARYGIDVRTPQIGMSLDATLYDARLSSLAPKVGEAFGGVAQARVKIAGKGRSIRQIVTTADGDITLRLRDGELKRSTAKVLSGALVEGALASVFAKSASTPLSCAKVEADIGGGRIASRGIVLVTGAGTTVGAGHVDLRSETMAVGLIGQPRGLTLFKSRRPVTIAGPMLDPKVDVRGDPSLAPPAGSGDPVC